MSYLDNDFEREFMKHTLELLTRYDGPYDATILVNCLLGLLVVPKETFIDHIPEEPLDQLEKWGIRRESIKDYGRPTKTNPKPDTLRGLVRNLRHAVAHFRIEPLPASGEVMAFKYSNDCGLRAEISLSEMREFTRRLATYLN